MANITITNLPAVTSLNGTEDLPAVQSGVTVRLTTAQIAAYTASTFAVPSISIGNNIGGSTPGNGLYVNGSSQLGQFPYGSGVFTALQTSTGSTGGPVLYNGAGGTPSSMTLTIGSISISGAPNSYLLYNNNGSLGAIGPTVAFLQIGSPVLGATGSTNGGGLYVDNSTQLAQFTYGTGVRTALGVNVGSAGAPVLFNGLGGKPSSIDLTNATGLPLSSGVTGNLSVNNLNSGSGATASTYWRGDGTWASVSASSGTVTSVSFTGGIISVATPTSTPALTVSGTQGGIPYFSSSTAWTSSAALALNSLVIGGGTGAPATTTTGTGVLTALGNTTNAASGIAVKDANANLSANNLFETLTTITATGGVTTLTASSAYSFIVNGSLGHTIQLPDATTLPVGTVYRFNNNQSSNTLTVRNNSGTTIGSALPSGSDVEITLLVNSPAAGTWDTHTLAPSNVSWSTNTLSWTGTIGSGGAGSTWNAVPITIPYGGTGQTALATGDLIVGSGTNTSTRLTIGSTSQVLTVVGGTAAWATPASGSGTVNSGTSGQLTYYAATGTAVSGNANATISGGAVTLGVQSTTAGSLVLANTNAGAFPTTIKSSASATAAWSLTLPVTAGSSTNVLSTDGTGVTSWVAQGGAINVQTFTSSGTWTKPSYAAGSRVLIQCWGGGGAGGKATSAAGGGGGGYYNERWMTLSDLTSSVTVTVAGNASGVATNINGTSGNPTTFGSYVSAYGGAGGGNGGQGGGSGGAFSVGDNTNTSSAGNSGTSPLYVAGLGGLAANSCGTTAVPGTDGLYGGGGGGGASGSASTVGAAGGKSVWGGGGGGGGGRTGAGGAGGSSSYGGAGGAGSYNATATSGSVPGGGGGGVGGTGTSGAGAAGQAIVTVFPA